MAGTSRRPHVVTSQRRDVGSTNIKVNNRQRRDVSASSAFSSLKAKKGAELEVSGLVRTRARKSEQSDIDLERRACDLYSSLFWILELMFYISHIGIFLFMMF